MRRITLMQWYNEPGAWSAHENIIAVTTNPDTDFWRRTHIDFVKDDGHFYYQEVSGDFTLEVKVTGEYRDLYDQAGLMLRIDETRWIKTGIEYMEGVQNASVVVTRDFSDWSIVPLKPPPAALWLHLKRYGHTVEIQYSTNGRDYALLRQAYFPPEA